MNGNITENLSFEQQQAVAYAFLSVFYTREELGYSVDHHEYTDVTQDIIDIVNRMGKEITTNTKILVVADIFKTIAEGTGNVVDFINALVQVLYSGNIPVLYDLINMTEKDLINEKNKISQNRLAYVALIQILNREKGNIELKFMGF